MGFETLTATAVDPVALERHWSECRLRSYCEIGRRLNHTQMRFLSINLFSFETLVSDVAREFGRQIEFVVDKIFHVNAGDAGVLKQNPQGWFVFV